MTRIHNPPHPGETLRENVLPALGIAQQAGYDLWQARKAGAPKVKRAPTLTAD